MKSLQSYLLILICIACFAYGSGKYVAYRFRHRGSIPKGKVALIIAVFLAVWIGSAWLAGLYADTDWFGWQCAEWLAHSGKWFIFMAGSFFGLAFASTVDDPGSSKLQSLVWLLAFLMVLNVVVVRTLPIYVLLKNDQRDDNQYLRQPRDYHYTSAAVALVNYLEQYRGVKGLTQKTMAQASGVTTEGATWAGLLRAARQFGASNATCRRLKMDELIQGKTPALVLLAIPPDIQHASLLTGIDGQNVHFIDPDHGRWQMSRQRFNQIWRGKTITFER